MKNQLLEVKLIQEFVWHHSKEKKSLFPTLEQARMPSNMESIAMMLIDYQCTREIRTQMEESAKE